MSLMTRELTNEHPQSLLACNFLSQYYFNIFLLKSYRFFSSNSYKVKGVKTGSDVGILSSTAVRAVKGIGGHLRPVGLAMGGEMDSLKNERKLSKKKKKTFPC